MKGNSRDEISEVSLRTYIIKQNKETEGDITTHTHIEVWHQQI
jgi:hypothetical protein